ncbi:hypothetical protein [Capnocytophaga catalasegens]|nr:hypothetical protein [Capnocytophaga catalasegens]
MKYIFDTFPDFNKSFKKLLKKYKSLKDEDLIFGENMMTKLMQE